MCSVAFSAFLSYYFHEDHRIQVRTLDEGGLGTCAAFLTSCISHIVLESLAGEESCDSLMLATCRYQACS
jgi:hypothetical protein